MATTNGVVEGGNAVANVKAPGTLKAFLTAMASILEEDGQQLAADAEAAHASGSMSDIMGVTAQAQMFAITAQQIMTSSNSMFEGEKTTASKN